MCHLYLLLANYLDPSKSSCSVIAAKVSREFGITIGKTSVSYVIKPLRRYEECVPSPSPPPLTYKVSPLKYHHLSKEYRLYPPPPKPPKQRKKRHSKVKKRSLRARSLAVAKRDQAEAARPQDPPFDSQPVEPQDPPMVSQPVESPPLHRESVLPLSRVELKNMKFALIPAGQSRKAKRKALKRFKKKRRKAKSVCIKGTRDPSLAKRSGAPQKTKSVLPASILDPVPR